MKLNIIPVLAWCACMGSACSDNAYNPGEPGAPADPMDAAIDKSVVINPAVTYQTMQGIGASDCWMGNWVGRDWTTAREGIARLLFSQEIVDGQPQGIGLSMWRVNVGAGSAERGDKSGITTVHRRAECFVGENGEYDWSKCAGQQYFMQQAKAMGTERFVLFSNSPLLKWTYNGQGRSDRGNMSNLMPKFYGDFAGYLADVAEYYIGKGFNVTDISPVNEPNVSWNGHDQEGSGWTIEETARLARELDRALAARTLPVNILLAEGDHWDNFLADRWTPGGAPARFWTPGDDAYIGDLDHVKPIYCGHSYWTDTSWDYTRSVRARVAETAALYGLEIWQSEWCMLGDDIPVEEFPGHSAATDLDRALHMSKVIHNDFTVGNMASWCYWVAMDQHFAQYGDRWLLVFLDMAGGEDSSVFDGEGSFAPSANLWALGNYSRFIRPGFRRVDLSHRESRNFFGSAYLSPEGTRIVAVYTNMGRKPVRLAAEIEGAQTPRSVRKYTTSDEKSLEEEILESASEIVLDPRSITTVVYDL